MWRELASIRNSSRFWLSHKPTLHKPPFFSSLLYLHPIVVSLPSLELCLWANAHASWTCTISVMLSNGLEAQVRTDLTAVGLISRNTWWVPTLMPRLIYEAWDRQQLLSKPMSHVCSIIFYKNKGVVLAVISKAKFWKGFLLFFFFHALVQYLNVKFDLSDSDQDSLLAIHLCLVLPRIPRRQHDRYFLNFTIKTSK